ncbi:recombinase family protein [Agromyces protaetiae]|uniref:Recombinase family protein n=1 Tax=Agromyces protaetiae TaxID=2509455 RepID=A0A4P6FEA9_9MICO|nr:recombinase family protein [Agromyces protaetiae]QAY74264.1 recombinase family protein [Agromyces protaetiae]
MTSDDNRSDFYNSAAPPGETREEGRSAAKGLDFEAKQSVNPEDLTEGEPPMSLSYPPAPTTGSRLTSTVGLEHLFAKTNDVPVDPIHTGGDAVLYLRVSTTRQLNTAADLDEDGNSIATQREWGLKKTRQLKARIVREFVEPGQSAQTIDKRPEFKKLLQFIDENPNVRYVVIYMRSRAFRSFADATITKRRLEEKGVRLVSAKEEFGDGYMGDAMEAITDIMNEVQVRMSGEDIRAKLAHKVERGGSVGRAKLGYLNVRKDFDGRLVNTIDVDPVRAPLIAWAFEQYATNQYSVWQLASMLEDQGLVTRPSQKRPAKPLSPSALAKLLRDPYYTGIIRFKGDIYPGRHEPIISKETFIACQEILSRRNRKGDRDLIHFHYMKGMLTCGECARQGRQRRLVYSQSTGHGGTYEYWVCSGKQREGCRLGSIRMDDLEAAVARAVAAERFSPESLDAIRAEVDKTVAEFQASDREVKKTLRAEFVKLEAQEDRLIELAADGSLATSKLRERLEQVSLKKGAIQEKLAHTEERLHYGAELVLSHVDLLANPIDLFNRVPDHVRKDLLGALFTHLVVQVDDDKITISSERAEVNDALHHWDAQRHLAAEEHTPAKKKAPRISARGSLSTSETVHLSKGWNILNMVGLTGFEPATP